jgi:polyisoprenyl-phosphate glycosyltransferase
MENQATETKTLLLSIVVPVYRSAKILPKLAEQVYVEANAQGLADNFELILVNDASPDNSWQVISTLAKNNSFIKGISLRRNFGQHNATMAGLNYAQGKIIVIMDDDLQHPPQAIGELISTINEGYDVCYTRYKSRKHAIWKKFGSWFNNLIATVLLGKPKSLYLSSFKAIKKEVVDEIIKYDGPFAYVDGLILDVTRSINMIEIEHQKRLEGSGNYNLRRSVSLWLKMATSFSILPLRIATMAGFAFATLSLVLIGFVIWQKIYHPELPAGWASLIATVLLIGGVQTLCIGMVGEYLGRTYLKLNNKPQFVVGKTAGFTREKHEQA